jgi:carbon storage regulator
MLKLDRKVNETIMVGHDIEIEVVNIREDRVCLGIAAPKYVSVHRREVYDDIANHGGEIGGTSDLMRDELRKLVEYCVVFSNYASKWKADAMVEQLNRTCLNAGLLHRVETHTRFEDYALRYINTDAITATEGI